jgi:hypothetical protein
VLRGSASTVSRIQAGKGWQASRASVTEGTQYSYETDGEWSTGNDADLVSAAGVDDGTGRLVAVIQYQDTDGTWQLSEPIELGASGTFTAPISGDLFLRCQDDWGAIEDNRGQVEVTLKVAE